MKCCFHSDADGFCSAYWVRRRFCNNNPNPEDFIMVDYGHDIESIIDNKIKKDEKVIIVDFSLELDMMRKLLNKTKDVIWIDHHVSAIEKYKDFDVDIKGLRYNGVAGCMLTYCYFFEMKDGAKEFDPKSMTIKAPWMTKYIADHDVWTYEYKDETVHFKLGLDACGIINPCDKMWDELLDIHKVRELIDNGTVIEKYRDAIGNRAVEMYSFEYEFDGHKTLCLNNVFGGSEWFGEKIKEYDIVCSFHNMNNKLWEYSLYSTKDNVDCSEICKKFGGGGHKGAAGFTSDKFIFK